MLSTRPGIRRLILTRVRQHLVVSKPCMRSCRHLPRRVHQDKATCAPNQGNTCHKAQQTWGSLASPAASPVHQAGTPSPWNTAQTDAERTCHGPQKGNRSPTSTHGRCTPCAVIVARSTLSSRRWKQHAVKYGIHHAKQQMWHVPSSARHELTRAEAHGMRRRQRCEATASSDETGHVCLCACLHACVRACLRARVRACGRACVRAYARAHECTSAHAGTCKRLLLCPSECACACARAPGNARLGNACTNS